MKKFQSLSDLPLLARKLLMAAMLIVGATAITACDRNEGPMEEAGESLDESFENAKESYEEGVEEVKDEYDDHTTE